MASAAFWPAAILPNFSQRVGSFRNDEGNQERQQPQENHVNLPMRRELKNR